MTTYFTSRAHLAYSDIVPSKVTDKWHRRLVKEQTIKLERYGTCYCYNKEQQLDIQMQYGLPTTVKVIDDVIWIRRVK